MTSVKDFSQVALRMNDLGLSLPQVEKEVSFAVQIIHKSTQLQKCTPESYQQAVLNIAQVGLTLNPVLKLAYLVPRWDRLSNSNICCLEPSYQGFVKLLTDTKSVKTVACNLVYESDFFEVNAGDFNNPITHKPKPFTKDRGAIVGAYTLALLPSGVKQYEAMSIDEIYAIRDNSESYKAFKAKKISSCIWVDHEGEMIRKTVIRRAFKYLPKSENFEKVANAIDLDESDYKASDDAVYFAQNLLETAVINDRKEVASYERRIESANPTEIGLIIDELKELQPEGNMSQTDILNKLKKQGL